MNSNVTRALFRDAFAQVVDNRVFRILLVILCVLVLPTFLIGARPDHLTVLFFWNFPYDEIFGFFGTAVSTVENPDRVLVQAVQKILTDGLAGSFGIMFGIAATAFFVPRMLEKGAADIVFSKPVSRFALLLTRYFAGLIFAGVLATTMIGGMHLGFLLVSGWSDPGFLWSIPILIYVFAVMHAVSVLVGVMTRSSVAAMLVTLVFFLFNGGLHQAWHVSQRMRGESRVVQSEPEESEEPQDGESRDDDEHSTFATVAIFAFDTAHFVLPKTTEADFIARSTRLRLERRGYEFWDRETNFFVAEPPEGFTREAGADIDGGGLVWSDTAEPNAARIVLARKPVLDAGTRMGASKKWHEALQTEPQVVDATREKDFRHDLRAYVVRWTRQDEGAAGRRHARWFFEDGAWLYTFDVESDLAWVAKDENVGRAERYRHRLNFGEESVGNEIRFDVGSSAGAVTGVDKRYGWDAELKYNYFFSIGSTLAFIVVVLLLARWKLARIDF
ncbi:MAG: hypothetical protein HZA52_00050 [Planctomycetes bacterium]|nr:hypothetical protein [Planctomycetota bacterium]